MRLGSPGGQASDKRHDEGLWKKLICVHDVVIR